MSKKINNLFFLLLFMCISCLKEPTETITIEGTVQDKVSKQPLRDVYIIIDGIKSATSGFGGIIGNGERKNVGNVITDVNGHYKVKLNVFKGADRVNFYLNPEHPKKGYVENQEDFYLSAIRSNGNLVNFKLSPTAKLKINFKNVTPFSDADFFYFGWYVSYGEGWPEGVIQEENCGTVKHDEAITWTGKDVCGTYTIGTFADQYTRVYWLVKKNGIQKEYRDSVYVKRGALNQFSLNY